jgi:hypothetical protein
VKFEKHWSFQGQPEGHVLRSYTVALV